MSVSPPDPSRWVSGASTAPAFTPFVKAICCVAGNGLQNTAMFWIFWENQEKELGFKDSTKPTFPGEGEAEDGVCSGDGECGCAVEGVSQLSFNYRGVWPLR